LFSVFFWLISRYFCVVILFVVGPIEELVMEHQLVRLILLILGRICERIECGESVDVRHLRLALEFIRVFVVGAHHAKEDEALIPLVSGAGLPGESGPLAAIRSEHEVGRGYFEELSRAVAEYEERRDRPSSMKVVNAAKRYIELLDQHMDKEDNVVYPLISRFMDERLERILAERFRRIDVEAVGAEKYERLQKILAELKSRYLK
jgi:hemerythrin-like domain-containing protein